MSPEPSDAGPADALSHAPAPAPSAAARTVSVVVPMWNEEEMLPRTIEAFGTELDSIVADGLLSGWEMVIVDDGSTDATGKLADEASALDPRIVVRHHATTRRLGAAIRTGLAAASGDLVLYTDADLPFDPSEIRTALRLMDLYDADVVSAYRHHRTGEGPLRVLYSYVYNLMVRLTLGLAVRDVNFAFKMMRRGVVDPAHLRSEGSFIDAELLARARGNDATVVQFGVDYFPRTVGVSTLSSPGVIVTILREMASLSAELRRSRPAGQA
jgi:glycosyltransferase involved in cell wall biosynthesis